LKQHADAHKVEVERSDRFKRLVSKNKANKKAGALKVFLTTSSIVYPTFAKNF
jgi:hypothetical protein